MSLFRDNAPLYWNVGLPAMPLKRWDSPGKGAGKAPILNEWTQYGDNMPSKEIQGHWLATYPDSNIGLPFGPASGLCAIDIDTIDPEHTAAILGALPKSPWTRIGQKGMGLIYRWKGQANFKLRNSENESIVEFLGKGNQMVLPPSIHPKTGKPYVSDTNLWEVMDQIPHLPDDIELVLRKALDGVAGLTLAQHGRSGPVDVVPQGERDIQMVRRAGYYARVVRGIDKTEKFGLADAMEHMRHWVENFTAHTSGDDMDPDKGVAKLVEYLLKDVEGGATLPNGWDVGLTVEQRAHPSIAAIIEKNTVQRWDTQRALDYLNSNTSEQPGDLNWAMRCVQDLISELARDENFSEMEFKALAGRMKDSVPGVKLSKPDLVTEFKQNRKGETDDIAADHEEIGRQVLEDMGRGGEIKFSQGSFWQWNGSCYEQLTREIMYKRVAESVKGNILARRDGDYNAIVRTMSVLAQGELIEQEEVGINFANGFLDVNLKLHEHSPKYGKTFTMPFDYIPERANEAHRWLEFLETCWGDDDDYAEKVDALQEAFAATMFGIAPTFQRCFLLHGRGRTGKTQALEVLRAMMPPASSCSVGPHLWGERFVIGSMVGKTLNVCGELPEDSSISGNIFKEIVEGTTQETEFKGRDRFKFKPFAAHWFASNFLPKTKDTSGAFLRRWLIFDFTRVVTDKERIVDFYKVLVADEREAIAAWAVKGLARLMKKNDYTLPKTHFDRINQLLRSNNSVAAFLQSCEKVKPEAGYSADVRSIFDHYVFYMKDVSKGWNVTYERFKGMLDDLGFQTSDYVGPDGVLRHQVAGLHLIQAMLPPRS